MLFVIIDIDIFFSSAMKTVATDDLSETSIWVNFWNPRHLSWQQVKSFLFFITSLRQSELKVTAGDFWGRRITTEEINNR